MGLSCSLCIQYLHVTVYVLLCVQWGTDRSQRFAVLVQAGRNAAISFGRAGTLQSVRKELLH